MFWSGSLHGLAGVANLVSLPLETTDRLRKIDDDIAALQDAPQP
jgi:hypothetical protein